MQFRLGQIKPIYPHLSGLLIKVYHSPTSTSSVERNHKVFKKVLTQARMPRVENTCPKQVAIVRNNVQLQRLLDTSRVHCVQDKVLAYYEEMVSQPSPELATSTIFASLEANMGTVDKVKINILQ